MKARAGLAAAVLLAWVAGLGVLARRELMVGGSQRLTEAAARVQPGAVFFAVHQGDQHIGFASSTIDTTTSGLLATDYLVADLPIGGRHHRASARSAVNLTRGLKLRDFTVTVDAESGRIRVDGRPEGDSVLVLSIAVDEAAPDTQRMVVRGPVLLPTLMPLAVMLARTPKVGRTSTVAVFDPTTLGPRDLQVTIAAESVFTLADSARYDSTARLWVPALTDTVRAWRLETDSARGFTGWVDAQGRVVRLVQPGGIVLRRTAYEIAFDNWRLEGDRRGGRRLPPDQDIFETTAIAASAPLGGRRIDRLRVRLSGVDLAGFDLDGGRQRLRGDTLLILREPDEALDASYTLSAGRDFRDRFRRELAPEPLVQSGAWPIISTAIRVAGKPTTPREVARRLNTWVHDSLEKEISVGVPSAIQVLRARSGDCNEHTVLFVAMARALGIPARSAAGLAFVNGKFYYHAWPEIYLDDWVAVDPTFGEFPADAAHLRFVTGGVQRQAELLRLIGNLKIEILKG